MEYKSSFYQLEEVRLHVVEAGPANGPLLMFLHGFPEFWYGWYKQIPYFAERGFRVVVPDQRGYNLSDKPLQTKEYTLDKLVQDIVQLVHALGSNKVTLVGHDWGGIVAWGMGMWYPAMLDKLVILNAPHPAIMLETLKNSIRQKMKSSYAAFFQLPWLPEFIIKLTRYHLLTQMMQRSARKGAFVPQDLVQYRKAMSRPGSISAMLRWYRAARYETKALEKRERVEVPTLLLWGKKDQFMKAEMAEQSIHLCNKGKLTYLQEATHWLHHEEWERINYLIQEFLIVPS